MAEFERNLIFEEVSPIARVSVRTLRKWHAEGRGPRTFRVGHRLLVRESDLAAWLEQRYASADGGGRDAAA